jgi:hypothetical protein
LYQAAPHLGKLRAFPDSTDASAHFCVTALDLWYVHPSAGDVLPLAAEFLSIVDLLADLHALAHEVVLHCPAVTLRMISRRTMGQFSVERFQDQFSIPFFSAVLRGLCVKNRLISNGDSF